LENHEHAHALQDQMPSANAAINLKLKNKAKGIWSQSVEVGSGAYAEGMLWKGTARAMYFGKAQQHLLQYSGDNMGNGLDAALAHYGISANTNPLPLPLVIAGWVTNMGYISTIWQSSQTVQPSIIISIIATTYREGALLHKLVIYCLMPHSCCSVKT